MTDVPEMVGSGLPRHMPAHQKSLVMLFRLDLKLCNLSRKPAQVIFRT